MSVPGQSRRFVDARGTSAVRSFSDIGARVCPTAVAVNAAMIEAATTNSGTKRNCSAS
jgi:hypothetical protein